MNRHFYSHLVQIEEIDTEIDLLEISESQKQELKDLARLNLHHAVVDSILSRLTAEEKKRFLLNLSSQNNDVIFSHLKKNVSDIEEVIKKSASEIKAELKRDIREAKK